MPTKKEIKETINALTNGQFHIGCPDCQTEINLSQAGLFHLDDFTPEAETIYKQKLDELKEQRAWLRQRKKNIPKKSEVGAKAVNLGFLLERLAPTLDDFTFDKNDCRFLGDPIDFVIFEGLSRNQKVEKIIFGDFKSGKAVLSPKQKKIKASVNDKRVEFKRYES